MTVVGIEWTLGLFGIGNSLGASGIGTLEDKMVFPGATWWVDWSDGWPPSGTWRHEEPGVVGGVPWSQIVDDLGRWGTSEMARLLNVLERLSSAPLVMEVVWSQPTTGLRLAMAARSSDVLGPRDSRLAAVPSWVDRSLLPLADVQEVMLS